MSEINEKSFFPDENEGMRSDAASAKAGEGKLDPPEDLTFDFGKNFGSEQAATVTEETASVSEKMDPVVEETVPEAEAASDSNDVVEAVAEDETPEWLSEYVSVTNAHFQNLRALIKYTKTKDESIYKLSNELQKYREDYCTKTFKPIGMAIISFREDCRKSMSDIAKYNYDAGKVDKYLDFLADDYFEMLSNVGIEEQDDAWMFNGSPLRQTEEEKEPVFEKNFTELKVAEDPNFDVPVVKSVEDLVAYLKTAEDDIKIALENNEILDQSLKAYIDFSFNLEKNLVKSLVFPALRSLLTIGGKLKSLVEESRNELTEDNCNARYMQCLEYVTNALEDVLISGGITIDADVRDEFDPKRDRLLKTVMTNDAALDRKIAFVHTECYVMNERVIYPSKVDVYKFTPKTEEN